MADTDTTAAAAADVPEKITVHRGVLGSAECRTLQMDGSCAGLITVEGHGQMSQCGAGAVLASNEVAMSQSGAGLAIADRVDVRQGFVGVLVASEASFDEESKVIITAQSAILFGAVLAVVFGAVVALGDYFIRGMFND